MQKKILLLLVLISLSVNSQNFVTGSLNPQQNYEWVVLYQLKGAKQLYIKNETITNGKFSVAFPENATKGMYRIMFSQNGNGTFDFLYNKENIELSFNPENPIESLVFLKSEENIIYQKYQDEFDSFKQKLDSLQLTYFKLNDFAKKEKASKVYETYLKNFNNFQNLYEKQTENKLANHFIKATKKYYANTLFSSPQQYLNSEKKHFFDFVNFEDEVLRSSIFYSEKIIEYIFYMNRSSDRQVQIGLLKNSVNEVFNKIENQSLKSELLITLLYTFAQVEDVALIDYVIKNHYNKLPEAYKNNEVITDLKERIKLAIGKQAPEIIWEENGISKKLSNLDSANNYIVVFWSTGCSHCLVEVPQLYELTKDNPTIKVIAFAMEKDELGFNHHTQKFEKWTNILGLGKWDNPITKNYNIVSTPTYFILDANKRIIAKPEFFKDVKSFFEN
tara:strand:+ start:12762 stop:14102 length:1341 start_codon:yes stop_codon:yes gene_type:complete